MTAPARTPIVVGIDADPSHRTALTWGADDAHRRHLPLRLVLVRGRPDNGHPSEPAHRREGRRTRIPHANAERTVREAAAFVQNRHPRLEVSTLLATGAPVPVLREQARTAAAVVLGSRRTSRREGLFAKASVAPAVIGHATCPVVVVRDPESVRRQPPFLVVGVNVGWDGRRHSAAAVIHAFEEAARRGAELRVLHVWHPPLLGIMNEQAALRECRWLLSEMVAGWRTTHPDVEVRHAVLRGHPVQVLARESAHALALIVGTRGHSRLPGLPLSSVITRALHHAQCPVVAVPQPHSHRHTRVGPMVRRLFRGARKAVERYIRLPTSPARTRLGRAVPGTRHVRPGRHHHAARRRPLPLPTKAVGL